MKKLLLFIITIVILSGCNKIIPDENRINNLKHITIETAKNTVPDSIVIVTQDYKDYVFIKKNGEIKLIKEYISSEGWIDAPGLLVFLLAVVLFVTGIFIGTTLRTY